jgi:hypothetical protein
MVRFTDDYVEELNTFHSKRENSILYVTLCYIRGISETLGVILFLYYIGIFDNSYYHDNITYLVYNTFAIYATVSITTNSLLSCIMYLGGGDEVISFIPLMVSGVAKIQIFHPHSIYRNIITRPFVAGFIYAIVICIDVFTLKPPIAGEILTPEFLWKTYLMGSGMNAITGLIKTLIWHWAFKRESIFKVRRIVKGVECGTKTSPDMGVGHIDDSPQNDNLNPIIEGGEYVPPKVQNYFSCSV